MDLKSTNIYSRNKNKVFLCFSLEPNELQNQNILLQLDATNENEYIVHANQLVMEKNNSKKILICSKNVVFKDNELLIELFKKDNSNIDAISIFLKICSEKETDEIEDLLFEKNVQFFERKIPSFQIFKLNSCTQEEFSKKLIISKKIDGIYSVYVPKSTPRYFILEGMLTEERIKLFLNELKIFTKKLGEIPKEEAVNLISPEVETKYFKIGDIVEILNKNFKQKRAEIIEIDVETKQLQLKLLDSYLNLTVYLPENQVRILRKND